jgi:hypothetical protein
MRLTSHLSKASDVTVHLQLFAGFRIKTCTNMQKKVKKLIFFAYLCSIKTNCCSAQSKKIIIYCP